MGDDVDKTFIKADEFEEIKTKFEQTIIGALREVENQIERTKKEVPVWLIVLLVAFGWNEMTLILYNPLYFFLCAVCCMIVYVIFRLQLVGPVTSILKEVLKKVQSR
eukprot:TRINITY_DN5832_c0_g1_i1.p1 TRINITY_DN5832_c0_g1~~TRINITY_DN5832_c0_g1_i1.p1  ORF type:complete len:107 (+),score=14.49 TRINITY_DN5832_c0_g1_i1:89-409(+)